MGDKNLEIREKTLEAVCVISGEEIEFDVQASGKVLTKAVDELRGWWEERKLSELEATEDTEPAADYETADEVETETDIEAPTETATADEDLHIATLKNLAFGFAYLVTVEDIIGHFRGEG